MKMRKSIIRSAVVAVVAAAAVVVPSAAYAVEDNGDGTIDCKFTEICFQYVWTSNHRIKHFHNGANHYFTANHGGYHWWDTIAGHATDVYVMDEAMGLRNRDSTCMVVLWDVDGFGNWFVYDSQPKNYDIYENIGGMRNNGHSRCGNGSPAAI